MADNQPDAQKPEDPLLALTALLRCEVEDLRGELRQFILQQIDDLRVQIEAIEQTGIAHGAEIDMIRKGFERLQTEMREGFEKGRLQFAGLHLELAALTTQLPHAEQLPSIELMTEIKQVLEERRDQKESRKQTRFLLKRGMFWLPFAVLAAVLGEPAERWVGLKTGWW